MNRKWSIDAFHPYLRGDKRFVIFLGRRRVYLVAGSIDAALELFRVFHDAAEIEAIHGIDDGVFVTQPIPSA